MEVQLIPNVISHRIDRKERLVNELKGQGIEKYVEWDGVWSEKTVVKNINLAHKQIVEWARDENLEKVLIMEDDIQFCDKGAFDYYLQNEPADYDIYLAGIYLGVIKNDNTVSAFTGMHCYIVHNRFYDTFLNTSKDIHIDHSLKDLGKYVVCNPFAAVQYNGWSDNSQKYCNYDCLLEHRKLYKHVL